MDYYQAIVYALIAGFVVVFWKAAQWTLASTKAIRESETLTPADLEALQQACEGLIADLREAADETTARVNHAVSRAEIIVSKLNDSLPVTRVLAQVTEEGEPRELSLIEHQPETAPIEPEPEEVITDPTERIYRLADRGKSPEEIARMENRSPGEVKLILDLRTLQQESEIA